MLCNHDYLIYICYVTMEDNNIPIAEPVMLRDIKNIIYHNRSYFRRNGIYLVENNSSRNESSEQIPNSVENESRNQLNLTNYYTVNDLIRDYEESIERRNNVDYPTCCCNRITIRNINYCAGLVCIVTLIGFSILAAVIAFIEYF